jgi:hypothetical protein
MGETSRDDASDPAVDLVGVAVAVHSQDLRRIC